VFPRWNSPLAASLGYSAANFLIPQILAHEDAKTQLFVVSDALAHRPVTFTTLAMTSHYNTNYM